MLRSVLVASLLLAACKDGDSPAAPKPIAQRAEAQAAKLELPKLARTGTVDAPPAAPVLAATPQGITVDGKPVVVLRDGALDPADREGGAQGRKITKLTAQLSTIAANAPPSTLALALDPRLSYDLLVSVLFSAKQKEAGWKQFALLVNVGGTTRALPITLPDKRTSPDADAMAGLLTEQPAVGGRHDRAAAPRAQVMESEGPQVVLAKIQSAYLAGIKRCYRDELRRDPTRRGKLALRVTVSPTGIAKGSSAEGLAAACTEKLMQSWRFPILTDERGEPTRGTFALTLQLMPDDDDGAEQPAPPAPPPPPPLPLEPPLRLSVAVTAKEVQLWSFSGLEGTLDSPKLTASRSDAAAMTKLNDALREIAQRRWAGKPRPEGSLDIVLIADPETPMQTIAEVIATVRTTPDGQTLFPDVQLSISFQ